MNWRARLDALRGESGQKCPDGALPKLPQAPIVGFVSDPTGPFPESDPAVRVKLLALAADEWLPEALVHRLGPADLAGCIGLPDEALRAYLRALERRTAMEAGHVPEGWTTAALCEGCGPVWLWPDAARVVACPWCHVRKAGRYLPRPRMTCGECRYFIPDAINPPAGCGACGLALPYRRGERGRYPFTPRHCPEFRPP